jgi:glycosyltransferase involved in cell wall biosynthesis
VSSTTASVGKTSWAITANGRPAYVLYGEFRATPYSLGKRHGGNIFGDAAWYERELKAEIVRRGLAHRVLLPGHQEDIPALLAALDILVHASSNEPFGTILLEAGAARLPIAAYESGGVTEMLTHEVNALLVRQGDRAGLAAAVSRLIAQPDLARALGQAAQTTVRERFDVRRMVQEVQDVLGSLLREAAPTPRGGDSAM